MDDAAGAINLKATTPTWRRRLLGLVAVIAVAMLVLAIAAVVSLAVAYETRYAGRVYLGVIVAGFDVGGMTPAEVEALVADQPGPWWSTRLSLRFGERAWQPTLAELGIEPDTQATAAAAYRIGREAGVGGVNPRATGRPMDLGARLRRHFQLLREPEAVAVTTRFNEGVATAYLTALASEIDQSPRDATLTLNGLQVQTTPGHNGRRLDVAASLARLRQVVAEERLEPVDLVVRQVPPLMEDASEAAARLEHITSAPVTLTYGQQWWTVDRTTLADLVVIGQEPNDDGRARFTVSLDLEGLASVIGPLAAEINQPPRDAVLDFDAVAGQLVILAPSQEGQTLDVDESVQRFLVQITTSERTVPLAVTVQKPIVDEDDAPDMGIVELVAGATSYFYGSSAGRVNNIRLAASKFDRVLIPPNGIFSFNEHLGEVTAEEGYDETLIIADNRTSRGVGGGVCQVSTTAFRAAFWGGFPILERWSHGYRVGYYEQGGNPPGLDATIYTPSIDFQFQNDTPHWLLVKTYFDAVNSAVTFHLYGTKPDRVVELEGPVVENVVKPGSPIEEEDPELPAGTRQRVELAREGSDVTLYRIIKQGDVVLRWERFFSHYAATEERWRVGTGS